MLDVAMKEVDRDFWTSYLDDILKYSCKPWRILFKVHVDAYTLKYLTMMKNQSGLFTRWFQELAGFNLTVVHKKGKENSKADALSQSALMAEAPPLEEDEFAEFYKVNDRTSNQV